MTETKIKAMSDEQQGLIQNSILLKVSFGVLGNSKKSDTDVNTDADKSRFKVHKTLLESPELEDIRKADQALRMWLFRECIPFEMGVMLLSSAKLPIIWERLTRYEKVERPALIHKFIAAYPARVKESELALGPQEFNPAEFPPVEEVLKKFYFYYKPLSFNVPSALKVISKDIYDTEVQKAQANIQNITEEIQQAQRAVLLGLIETLDDQLKPGEDGKRKALHQGAISKLNKFLAEFHLDNVTGDGQTEALVLQLHDLTNGISAKGLKGKDDVKSQLAEKILSIKGQLGTMVIAKTSRKFKDSE
jgi:hypothetical protein